VRSSSRKAKQISVSGTTMFKRGSAGRMRVLCVCVCKSACVRECMRVLCVCVLPVQTVEQGKEDAFRRSNCSTHTVSYLETTQYRTWRPHSIVPHSILPHSIVPHSIVPYSIVPHSIVPGEHTVLYHSTTQYRTWRPHRIVPHSIVPHSIVPGDQPVF